MIVFVVVTLVEAGPLAAALAIRRGGGRHGRRRRRRFFGRRRRALLLVVADGAWPPRGRVAGLVLGWWGRVAVPRRREGAAAEGLVEEHFVSRARGRFERGLSCWSLAERPALEGLVFTGAGLFRTRLGLELRQNVRLRFAIVCVSGGGLGGAFAALRTQVRARGDTILLRGTVGTYGTYGTILYGTTHVFVSLLALTRCQPRLGGAPEGSLKPIQSTPDNTCFADKCLGIVPARI